MHRRLLMIGARALTLALTMMMRRARPRLCRRLTTERKYPYLRQSEVEARQAWGHFMTMNPFVYFGQTMGREPSEELPGFTELLSHVLGLTDKSPSEVANYERDISAKLDQYIADLGFERRSAFDIIAKGEEQSVDDFLRGAAYARETVGKWRNKEELEHFVPEKAMGPKLLEALNSSQEITVAKATPTLSRTMFVLMANVTAAECPPLSQRGAGWWFSMFLDFLMPRTAWRFDKAPAVETEDDNAVALYEVSRGTFFAHVRLSPPDLLEDTKRSDLRTALSRRNLAFPLPTDLKEPAKKFSGFLVADATFTSDDATSTWTFARQTDHRPDARWSHDWFLVDVDAIVSQHDWRKTPDLLKGLVGPGGYELDATTDEQQSTDPSSSSEEKAPGVSGETSSSASSSASTSSDSSSPSS